jgi:hypothetical protein
MFRATMCPSSGENTVPMRHLVFVTLYRWLSGMQNGIPICITVIYIEWHIPGVHWYGVFSWWWAHNCPKHVEKSNKYIKKNCAPSWFYLQDYKVLSHVVFSWWWAHSCPKHEEKSNKYIKENCAPSWFYLQDYTVLSHVVFSWWWAHSCPKHVEKSNKYIRENCAPSWFYLQDYTVLSHVVHDAVLTSKWLEVFRMCYCFHFQLIIVPEVGVYLPTAVAAHSKRPYSLSIRFWHHQIP